MGHQPIEALDLAHLTAKRGSIDRHWALRDADGKELWRLCEVEKISNCAARGFGEPS